MYIYIKMELTLIRTLSNNGAIWNNNKFVQLLKYAKNSKAVPLHAMEALGGRGGIAPTHSQPRH
jgi:hypothetical protein